MNVLGFNIQGCDIKHFVRKVFSRSNDNKSIVYNT